MTEPNQGIELLLLRLRNLIANKELEIAAANRELQNYDDWLYDHQKQCLDIEINIQHLDEMIERELKK